ncbi:putative Type II secretion system protein G (GspG) [Verrucomicrobia bacterium]|nr:putative Type II secretion system protein G (GspG) [Verrucomicrobiota bacterium]
MRRVWLFAVILGTGAGLTTFLVLLARPPAAPPLPKPNGYDDFLAAAAAWKGHIDDANPRDPAALRALVATNAQTLRCLRRGLDREFCLPFAITNMSSISVLVQLLAAEGMAAGLDHRFLAAARCYDTAIRFGNQISRGGPFNNRLVGISCETIGCNGLVQLMPKLTFAEDRVVLAELEQIDQTHVRWEDVVRNQRRLVPISLGKGLHPLRWAAAWRQVWKEDRRIETDHQIIVAHERLIATELALRCFRSDRGHAPGRLEELVAAYLPQIPQDPFSGQTLIYRPTGANWLLYSVGPDGVDHGGKPAPRASRQGDVFFDSPW